MSNTSLLVRTPFIPDNWEEQDIAYLCSVSPACAEFVDTESIQLNRPYDVLTISMTLNALYEIVLTELKALGITYLDPEDLSDFYLLKFTAYLRDVFSTERVLGFLKRNPELRTALTQHMKAVHDDELQQDIVSIVIAELARAIPQDDILAFLVHSNYDPQLKVTPAFINHFRSILDIDTDVAPADLSVEMKYVESIYAGRDDFRCAIDAICKYYPEVLEKKDNVDVTVEMKTYDMDKIAVDVVKKYAVYDTEEELPDYLKASAKVYMDRHHVASAHHTEYWIARQKTISPDAAGLACLTAHHYRRGMTQAEMFEALEDMFSEFSTFWGPKKEQQEGCRLFAKAMFIS